MSGKAVSCTTSPRNLPPSKKLKQQFWLLAPPAPTSSTLLSSAPKATASFSSTRNSEKPRLLCSKARKELPCHLGKIQCIVRRRLPVVRRIRAPGPLVPEVRHEVGNHRHAVLALLPRKLHAPRRLHRRLCLAAVQ